jgi:DNA-binding winged helix-turn-helix (wHTH) protein/tetratricopeptide (TPR) repeat protein
MSDQVVRFGTFELDRSTGELRSKGQRVPLQDQPAQLLSLLVGRPGEVVTRDELRRALWSEDTFVDFDTAMNVAVNKVRQALRDSAASPRFVETVPKRGYRFLADVRAIEPGAARVASPGAPEPAPPKGRPWHGGLRTVAGAVAAVVVIAVAVLLARDRLRPRPAAHAKTAVQPTNAAAYDRYQRARHLIDRRTAEDSRRAAELLEEAIALDPRSAPAQAALADAYLALAWLGKAQAPAVSRARAASRRALEIDPAHAEAHATLGIILSQFDWDVAAGQRELERAVELAPDRGTVLRLYSLFLWNEGRFEEALDMNERELALDPASRFANRNRAIILYYARRYEESITQARKTIELDRYFVTIYDWLGKAYRQLGREQEAVEAFITPLTFDVARAKDVETLRAALAQGGPRAFWRRWLELHPDPTEDDLCAGVELRLGDRDRAIALLETLLASGNPWIRALNVEPQWDPLRSDPRFQSIVRRASTPRQPGS